MDIFGNREKAILIYLALFFVWVLSKKDIRSSLINLLRVFFQIKILIVTLAMLLYVGSVVFLFYQIKLWDLFLIKDTIYWAIGGAFVLLLNTNEALQDENFFKKLLVDNLKLIIVLEFIINFYAFSFWVEMFLQPVLFLIIAVNTVAELKQEHIQAKIATDYFLWILGAILLVLATFNVINDYQSLTTWDNLRAFLNPPLLLLAYLPFLYFFSLIMAYESLFIRLDLYLEKDGELLKFTKRKVLSSFHINLGKLNRFAKEALLELIKVGSKDDVVSITSRFR